MDRNRMFADNFRAFGNEISLSLAYENAPVEHLRKLESSAIAVLHPIANRKGRQ